MTETNSLPKEDNSRRPTGGERYILFVVAPLVIILDQLTKRLIELWLPLNRSWAPLPELADYFKLTHVSNTGAAFGLFPSGSPFFTVVATLVAVVIVFYNFQMPAGHRLLRLALAMQLGGALGNLIDRLRLGHVTDFLDFGSWPVFNLADTAIVCGVVILGFLMLQEQRESRSNAQAEDERTVEERREAPSLPGERSDAQSRFRPSLPPSPPNERTTS